MDKVESLKEINKSIKGLKAQRSNESFEMMGMDKFNQMYYTHAPQTAMVASNDLLATTIAGTIAVGASIIYVALLKKHYLSKDIESLKTLKELISNGYNVLENTSCEQLETDIATRAYIKK